MTDYRLLLLLESLIYQDPPLVQFTLASSGGIFFPLQLIMILKICRSVLINDTYWKRKGISPGILFCRINDDYSRAGSLRECLFSIVLMILMC